MTNAQRQEMRHYARLGRVSAHLLHDISSPLGSAIINLERCRQLDSPALRQVKRDIQTMRRYIESARRQLSATDATRRFLVKPQVEQLRRLVLPIAKSAGVTVCFDDIPHCRLLGNPVKFQQLLANLIINAVEAYNDESSDSGRDCIVRVAFNASGSDLTIRVVDWGKGISAEQLEALFKPFYTGKKSGLGLGLTIVRDYAVDDFKGSVTAGSSLRGGTQFAVRLPLLGS